MIYAVHRVKSIVKLKIYNFTKETRVCAHQSVNVRSSLTVLTMNVEIFSNNFILKKFFKKLFKPKKCAKNVSALISISLSHRQYRGEIETYLQTLFLVDKKRF